MLSFVIACLCMVGFGCWIEVQVRRTAARRRALMLDDVMKELASWDRTKELGFDDVLMWEAAFREATGALPERSRTKELEVKHRADIEKQQRSYENSFDHRRRLAQSGNYAHLGAPIRIEKSYFGTGRYP